MKTHPIYLFRFSSRVRFSVRAAKLTLFLLAITALGLSSQASGQTPDKKSQAADKNLGQAADKNDKNKDTHKSVGFNLSADANQKDLGLPFYPGAKPYKGTDDSESGLNASFQGGSDAFKLVVMKLQSSDSPDKIAAFYRKALSKYGTVLDCSKSTGEKGKNGGSKNESDKNNNDDKNSKSNALSCEDDHDTKEGYSYRSGTKTNMHVVGIEPNGKSTVISLVYVKSPEEKGSKD